MLIGSNRHTVIAKLGCIVDTLLYRTGWPYVGLYFGFAIGAYLLVKRSLLNPIEAVTHKLQQQAEQDFRLEPNFTHQYQNWCRSHSYQLMMQKAHSTTVSFN